MRILITNDDGIHAEGLDICEKIARELSDDGSEFTWVRQGTGVTMTVLDQPSDESIAARPEMPRTLPSVIEKHIWPRVAVIIERPAIDRDEDVITPKTETGLDPDDLRLRHLVALQECISQNVASATREEHALREPPALLGILLRVPLGSDFVHR